MLSCANLQGLQLKRKEAMAALTAKRELDDVGSSYWVPPQPACAPCAGATQLQHAQFVGLGTGTGTVTRVSTDRPLHTSHH